MVKMVEIASFADPHGAELVAAFLQAQGVNAFAGSHYHGESRQSSVHDRRAETPVFVSESDHDEAATLLALVWAGDFAGGKPESKRRLEGAAELYAWITPSEEVSKLTGFQKIAPVLAVPVLIILWFVASQLIGWFGL